MRRILAVTATLLLLASLLGSVALADRGGRGAGQGNAPAPQQGGESGGGDEAPEPGNGRRPVTPPGQAVSAAVRSRFATEGETTGNAHRVRVQLQVEQPEDPEGGEGDGGDGDADDDVDTGQPKGLTQRILAWQRALANSAKRTLKLNSGVKPFMMVGEPVFAEDGTFSGVKVWKGNRLARNYYDATAPIPISIAPAGEIRLVDSSGVTVCDPATACLTTWLEDYPDAYVSVWGRVELDEDDEEVFVAYRITVTVPREGV